MARWHEDAISTRVVERSTSVDKAKQYWFFRACVDVIAGPGKIARKEKIFHLGLCAEIGKREAELKRDQILSQAINRPEVILTSLVKFGAVIDAHLLKLENSEESKPQTVQTTSNVIDEHFRPAFGDVRICDMDHARVQSWLFALPLAWCTRKKPKPSSPRYGSWRGG
jgi:hypothetical protein